VYGGQRDRPVAEPEAIKIARSDDERMTRIREITDEMRHLQEQKNEALRMKLPEKSTPRRFEG
jgi:hypothetical protein